MKFRMFCTLLVYLYQDEWFFHCVSLNTASIFKYCYAAAASIVLRTAATASMVLSTARKLLFAAAAGLCQPHFLVGCYYNLQHSLGSSVRAAARWWWDGVPPLRLTTTNILEEANRLLICRIYHSLLWIKATTFEISQIKISANIVASPSTARGGGRRRMRLPVILFSGSSGQNRLHTRSKIHAQKTCAM